MTTGEKPGRGSRSAWEARGFLPRTLGASGVGEATAVSDEEEARVSVEDGEVAAVEGGEATMVADGEVVAVGDSELWVSSSIRCKSFLKSK